MTATQEFLQKTYQEHYQQSHPALRETGEAEMINAFIPGQCPMCGELQFKKEGASCILQSRELTKKDTSGRFESILT